MNIFILLPNQLFKFVKKLKPTQVILLEHPKFFTKYKYHKQKLVLHRSTMKAYAAWLEKENIDYRYIEFKKYGSLKLSLNKKVSIFEPHDHEIKKDLIKNFKNHRVEWQKSPLFICSSEEIKSFFKNKKKYFLHSFYKWQRKRLNILMDNNQNPLGGKMSLDSENRKRKPQSVKVPPMPKLKKSKLTNEAIKYINKHFPKNPGLAEDFWLPITFNTANKWLKNFIENRLKNFGSYQDYIDEKDAFIFHSALSPLINIGLLTPQEVVKEVLKKDKIPLNSLEGFIRQIIGWREFVNAVYIMEGEKIINKNFFNFKNKLPKSYWNATTKIAPLDNVIKKTIKYGYAHHIERLMIIGNFMLLSEYKPKEIYNWFMEMYLDSYEWVMVPNVLCMSQYSNGGIMSTKPYISSSNYIIKMSNFKKGDWCKTWDSKFWSFLKKHSDKLAKNPRMKLMYKKIKK